MRTKSKSRAAAPGGKVIRLQTAKRGRGRPPKYPRAVEAVPLPQSVLERVAESVAVAEPAGNALPDLGMQVDEILNLEAILNNDNNINEQNINGLQVVSM